MSKKSLTTLLLVLSCMAGAFAIATDLNGKWVGKTSMNGNDLALTYTFKVDGDKLTGTVESPYGPSAIENGKIKGDSVSFTTTVQNYEIPQTGKIYADSVVINIDAQGSILHTVLTKAK